MYPKLQKKSKVSVGEISGNEGTAEFSNYQVELPEIKLDFNSEIVNEKRLVVNFKGGIPDQLNDVVMKIDYIGDTAMGFMNNDLVADEFYKGIPWEIGLRKFIRLNQAQKMNFYIRPIYKNAPFLVDLEEESIPSFSTNDFFSEIKNVEFIPVYKTTISF